MMAVTTDLIQAVKHINWPLLRQQKLWLLKQDTPQADGLIALLDSIQDAAVADGLVYEYAVFLSEPLIEIP